MCQTVGYRVSLPSDCKNNTTLRHGNPHPTVNLISNTNSGEPCFVSDDDDDFCYKRVQTLITKIIIIIRYKATFTRISIGDQIDRWMGISVT